MLTLFLAALLAGTAADTVPLIAGTAADVAAPPPRPRGLLIIHSGAHKTGTTTTQGAMGVLHARSAAPYGVEVTRGKMDMTDKAGFAVAARLRRNATVLVSSEQIGRDAGRTAQFQRLIATWRATGADVRAVVTHRRTAEWLVSQWSQYQKERDNSGLSFTSFVATRRRGAGLARTSFDGYNRLVKILGPANVAGKHALL